MCGISKRCLSRFIVKNYTFKWFCCMNKCQVLQGYFTQQRGETKQVLK